MRKVHEFWERSGDLYSMRNTRISAKWFCFLILSIGFAVQSFTDLVRASDLSPQCCDDLEARISELEATAARTGRQNLTVQIYGQVNKALIIWDDGFSSDGYVVDNDASSSRLGLIGETKLKADWYAGYRFEFEFNDSPSDKVFQGSSGDGTDAPDMLIRQSYWYIDSADFGRFSLGQQSSATDDITLINLGASMSNAALHYNSNFSLRLNLLFGLTTDLTWDNSANSIDSLRGDFARYDSPALYGFVFSAAAGEDDIWDVALRYHKDWNSVRFAAGVGYLNANELDFEDLRGSASAIHKPTGLFLSAAGGSRNNDASSFDGSSNAHFYFAQLGLKRRITSYGDTSFYGEFGAYNDYAAGSTLNADIFEPGEFTPWGRITESEVSHWGVGIEQAIESSGLLLYGQFHRYGGDIIGNPCIDFTSCQTLSDDTQSLPVEPWSAVVLGARMQF